MARRLGFGVVALLATVAGVAQMSCDDSSGSSNGGAGAGASGGANGGMNGTGLNGGGADSGAGADSGTGLTGGAAAMSCASGVAQCGDGLDNDNDGKVDMLDGECVSPCDNDEGSFATGISGDNIDACKQDCFFDGDSGQGNDGCEWNLKCDPKSPGATAAKPCPYDANFNNCPEKQSERCLKNCRSVTPNGCDCFGCCAFQNNNTTVTVMLTSSCSQDKLGDPAACRPCTQQTECVNTCQRCEICVGKNSLPDDCVMTPKDDAGMPVPQPDGGTPQPTPQCEAGVKTCGPGGEYADGACPNGTYCLTGCCILPLL